MPDDTASMFTPLTPEEAKASHATGPVKAADKVPILPVSDDAPPAMGFRHPKHGAPTKLWPYHDAAGRLMGYVARFDFTAEDGTPDKDMLPLTYCDLGGNKRGWRSKGIPDPRPLYKLPELAGLPDAVVIVTEGEKAADAAAGLFPELVTTTPMHGAKSPHKTDWSPLAGRQVVIWPDRDEPGASFAQAVAKLATEAGASSVAVVDVPADWPEGWDLADEPPASVTVDTLRGMIEAATPWQPTEPVPVTRPSRRRPRGTMTGRTDMISNRPVIYVIDGELPRVVDEAEAALLDGGAPLYQRGGLIVRPAFEEMTGASGQALKAPQLIAANERNVAEHMMLTANFEKFDGRSEGFMPCDCPEKVAQTYLARRGAWRLRRLAGIIDAPTLRADGSILDVPGYDEATGLLFEPHGVEFPPIPDRPTQADAADALKELADIIGTFPFVGSADRSVALSAILTALIRRSLPTAPLHGFSAPTAGSGKSFLVDIAALIATGRRVPVIAQGKTDEEAEKRLGAALMAGDAVISIDNCERPLGGDFLCQALTQPMVKTRVLGKSINVEVPSNAAMFATGNNLTFMGDMTRRALLCSLDPQVERPELRTFQSNPLDMVEADRGRYVVAGLTVLRAFHVAGRPQQVAPLGSFTEWSRWVRDAFLWLDEKDPAETMEKVRSADPKLEALATVMDQWATVIGSARVSAREVIEIATSDATESTPPYRRTFVYADFREALLVVAGDGGAINSRRLGKWLAAHAGRIVGGRKLVAEHGHNNTARWRLIQVIDRE